MSKQLKILHDKYHSFDKETETFIISVLFHEKIPVIIDYFMNVLYYFRKVNVRIFISCTKSIYDILIRTYLPSNITIISVRDDQEKIWGNVKLFEQHVKNFIYLTDNNINYDYFLFSASNDVFIRTIDSSINKYIINKSDIKSKVNTDIQKYYNNFLNDTTIWGWFKKMNKDTHVIDVFMKNDIIPKCNEMEGLILPRSFAEEIFLFYINNIYSRNTFYEYVMEEIYIPSYLYSKYGIEYNTITLREKWCKYADVKGIHGEQLYNSVIDKYPNLYSIKTNNRDYNDGVRVKSRKNILSCLD